MSRNITILITIFLFNTAIVFAQKATPKEKWLTFTKIYFEQGNWDAIIKLKDSMNTTLEESDTLLTRLGASYFYKEKYIDAEEYLKKSYMKNKKDDYTKELLYYATLYQGHELDANQLRNSMSSKLNKKIDKYAPLKTLQSITLEGGIRSLKETEIGGDITYLSLYTSWNLSNAIKLNAGVNYLTQTIDRGKYTQPEVYVSMPISLGNSWHITPIFNSAFTSFTNTINNVQGSGDTNLILLQLSLSKRWGSLRLEPFIGIQDQNFKAINTPSLVLPTTIKEKYTFLQYGLALFYNIHLGKNSTWIINPNITMVNANNNSEKTIYTDDTNTAFSLFNTIYINKWQLSFSYITKKNLPYAEKEGYYYQNFPYEIKGRYTASIGYHFKPVGIFFTYQNEIQKRAIETYDLHYNSFYLTLNFKF